MFLYIYISIKLILLYKRKKEKLIVLIFMIAKFCIKTDNIIPTNFRSIYKRLFKLLESKGYDYFFQCLNIH